MRISDWSSDLCSSDLSAVRDLNAVVPQVQSFVAENREALGTTSDKLAGVTQALTDSLDDVKQFLHVAPNTRSEEHTSELQSLMRISYAVFCLKKKSTIEQYITTYTHIH